MRATTVEEILRYCDRYRVTEASGGVPEYFFDRNYTRNGGVSDDAEREVSFPGLEIELLGLVVKFWLAHCH